MKSIPRLAPRRTASVALCRTGSRAASRAAWATALAASALVALPTATPAADRTASGPAASSATPSGTGRGCDLPGPYDYPQGSDPVRLRPADFSTRIDNPYFPMRPGTIWKYREFGSDGTVQRITVTVTRRTRMVGGIRARVVRDVVREGRQLVEDTRDWYAQDSGGNIWYLGEATEDYEDGKVVSTAGSWEHGRDGAQAGILVPARPRAGCGYREEYLAGEAEDQALVLSLQESMRSALGFHRRVLHTANSTPLEPEILENKFYARGIGPVLEINLSPEHGRAELVRMIKP